MALWFPLWCWGQISGPLSIAKPVPLRVRQGETATAELRVQLATGYHVNTNRPSDEYLIPLRLTWEPSPLEVSAIEYPKGQMERYQFSSKPLAVYTGDFSIVTKFKAPPGSAKGSHKLTGKLRYQACTESTCYPPKTLTVELPADIR